LDYVLGVGSASGFAYRILTGGVMVQGLCGQRTAAGAQEELKRLCTRLQERGEMPRDWLPHASGVSARWDPAGAALDMESHVAKRTLAIGQAGGFVGSYTNEGLYPAMWSGALAARIAAQALKSPHPQDKLRDFDRLWRTEMADHLRPPHTDAKSILPLVFSNQQVADRMLESFLLGSNF
jgi:flavin-dependent dehydrogenase